MLRRVVLATGLGLIAAGCAAVAALPLPAGGRALLALAWLAAGGFELGATRAAFRRCCDIRIEAGGRAVVRGPGGAAACAELAPGSVVTARIAWLRLKSADGSCYAELVAGGYRESEQWRRLQVIWRHIGASR